MTSKVSPKKPQKEAFMRDVFISFNYIFLAMWVAQADDHFYGERT